MEEVIKNGDTKLFSIFYPNPGKESVILLHGGPAVPEDMEVLAKFLKDDFQVIYFHQRGTLKSPCPSGNFSMKSYISDIDAIAAHYNLQKFHLFGHSWGGLYAPIYAEQRQERILSMFLCSPASGTGKRWIKMGLEVRRYNKKKSTLWEWILMNINSLLGLLGSTNAYKKLFFQFGINCNKGHGINGPDPIMIDYVKSRTINRINKEIIKYPKLKKISEPGFKITITYGDDDIYEDSPKYVKRRYPTAVVYTISNCGHMQWLHNQEDFFSILKNHYKISTTASK